MDKQDCFQSAQGTTQHVNMCQCKPWPESLKKEAREGRDWLAQTQTERGGTFSTPTLSNSAVLPYYLFDPDGFFLLPFEVTAKGNRWNTCHTYKIMIKIKSMKNRGLVIPTATGLFLIHLDHVLVLHPQLKDRQRQTWWAGSWLIPLVSLKGRFQQLWLWPPAGQCIFCQKMLCVLGERTDSELPQMSRQ